MLNYIRDYTLGPRNKIVLAIFEYLKQKRIFDVLRILQEFAQISPLILPNSA